MTKIIVTKTVINNN